MGGERELPGVGGRAWWGQLLGGGVWTAERGTCGRRGCSGREDAENMQHVQEHALRLAAESVWGVEGEYQEVR